MLILGDSISIGYTPHVQQLLDGRAVVVRPMQNEGRSAENCEGTTLGVERIDDWLALDGGRWDVIHFNFGLHDLKRVHPETGENSDDPADPRQAEPERYREQLRQIVAAVGATGARLVFATTTPVPLGVSPSRTPEDAARYNAVALEVLEASGFEVAIDDLYGFALPELAELQQPADVHFTAAGSERLAEQVAASILSALPAGRGAQGRPPKGAPAR